MTAGALVLPAARETGRALLVPGNDLGAEFYRPLGQALAARGVTAVLLTVWGQGAPRWEDRLEAVAQAWDEHRPGLLLGHSLGGVLALLLAARAPAGLERLVLLEPALAPWRWLATRAARAYRRDVVAAGPGFVNWTGAFRRVARPEAFPSAAIALYEANRRATDPTWTAALLDALPGLYPLPFAQVRVPVLVVRGARSGWRARLGLALLRRRLGARGVTIPGAAHWLANEADAAVAEVVACG